MPELETGGFKGWWEVKQYLGKDKNGVKHRRPRPKSPAP